MPPPLTLALSPRAGRGECDAEGQMPLVRSNPPDVPSLPDGPGALVDNRQSEKAAEICRGVMRVLAQHELTGLIEVTLANGRRADIMALSPAGTIWIVEIKSSVTDFQVDQKWPEYRDYCDALFFGVATDFPQEILPADTGLIVADRFGGEIIRPAPEHRLSPARRKALTLHYARLAAARLSSAFDPHARFEPLPRE